MADKTAIVTTLTMAAGQDTKVYPLIPIIGQSNADGREPMANLQAEYTSSNPNPLVPFFNGTIFSPIDDNPANNQHPTQNAEFGFEFSLGKKIADHLGHTAYMYKYGDGGIGLAQDGGETDWSPQSTGEAFDNFITTFINAKKELQIANKLFFVPAIIWIQGENDAKTESKALAYQPNTIAFIDAIKSRLSIDPPFIDMRIHNTLPIGTYAHKATVRTAKDNVAALRNDVIQVDTDAYGIDGDDIHYNAAGNDTGGQDLFDIIKPLL